MMTTEELKAEHLTPAEIDEICKRALKDVQLQLVQARMNAAMNPGEKALISQCADISRKLDLLRKHCNELQLANSALDEKPPLGLE